MRARLAFVLLATGAVLLAGCLGSSAPAPPAGPEKPATGAPAAQPAGDAGSVAPAKPVQQVVRYPFKGHLTTGLGAQGVGYVSPTGSMDDHGWTFAVGPGALAVVAELRWADKLQDLDLEVGTPDCDTTSGSGTCAFADGGAPGSGDSPARLVLTEPKVLGKAGAWKLLVWGKDAVNVDFEAAVTVFYGVGPGDGYTAFGSSG